MPADELAAVIVLGTGGCDQRQCAGCPACDRRLPECVCIGRPGCGWRRIQANLDAGTLWTGQQSDCRGRPVMERMSGSATDVCGVGAVRPRAQVTRCNENVLYELDEENALDIYKALSRRIRKNITCVGVACSV